MTTEEFVVRARDIWGDRYDYNKTVYVRGRDPVEIFCKVSGHGSFLKSPENHLHKTNPQGCPKCSGRGALPPVSQRVVGQEYDYMGMKRVWNGRTLLCEHNKKLPYCKICGGSVYCEHGIYKSRCKECGGSEICEHNNVRHVCKLCWEAGTGGASICEHGVPRSICVECKGGGVCEHNRIRSHCKECWEAGTGGGSYCEHGNIKATCAECGGSQRCEHGNIRSLCIQCGGGGLCVHNIPRTRCRECGGGTFCEHGVKRTHCKVCGGSQICEHGKFRFICEICDPHGHILNRMKVRLRTALTDQNVKKEDRVMDLVGCTVEELHKHLESMFIDGMSWDNVSEWHIDHRRPCASFDLRKEEDRIMCFHYTNLQPMWAKENLSKSDNFDEDSFDWTWDGSKWAEVIR